MEKLKRISLNNLKLDNILCLSEISSLRELHLGAVEGIVYDDLIHLEKLLDLSISDTEIASFDFIKKLKNLKRLTFDCVPMGNLNFLYDLPKLTEFTMEYRAEDETALACISKMKYLKCFQYPVADIGIYRECPKINSIGIDSTRVRSFDELEGNETITNVTVYYPETNEQYEQQIDVLKKYLNLRSYGCVEEL